MVFCPQIASEKDSIQTLVELLEIYLAKDVELMTRVKSSDGKRDKDRDSLIEDVLIKVKIYFLISNSSSSLFSSQFSPLDGVTFMSDFSIPYFPIHPLYEFLICIVSNL